jgi:predicted GNAT superfamily acetyltransferase
MPRVVRARRALRPQVAGQLCASGHLRMHISVSPTGFSDWPQLVGLIRDSFAYMDARIDPPSSLKKMDIEEFIAKAAEETLIVAEEDRRIIGCAFAALRADCVYVGKVAVARSARGKGVARAMFAAAETLARQHGRKFLELQTRVELIENHATFAALGFEKVGETAHPGYNRPTSITMRKLVTASAA